MTLWQTYCIMFFIAKQGETEKKTQHSTPSTHPAFTNFTNFTRLRLRCCWFSRHGIPGGPKMACPMVIQIQIPGHMDYTYMEHYLYGILPILNITYMEYYLYGITIIVESHNDILPICCQKTEKPSASWD